ncbi:MAG TPA: hypothetical protein VG893_13960 [Terracidiphilus sp.]|nr:hypothetical protein [Terracidiphilus sp.]
MAVRLGGARDAPRPKRWLSLNFCPLRSHSNARFCASGFTWISWIFSGVYRTMQVFGRKGMTQFDAKVSAISQIFLIPGTFVVDFVHLLG